MAGPGNILIKVGADAGQAVRELSTLNSSLGSTMSTTDKMSAGLRKAALPAAAALAAIGVAAVDAAKAAAEDAAAQEQLSGQLDRVTDATDAQLKSVEPWISSLTLATGVADDQLRPALGKLASATGDVGQAQDALKVALDVSAQSHKSVETVATALAKAYDGSTTSLKKLVPGLDEATLKSKDMSAIMDELAAKTGGAMAEQAGTATGQLAIFTNQMNELKESLGAGLLPVMQALMPALTAFGAWASEHTGVIQALVGVIAGFAGAIVAANVALKAYELAQIAVKAATVAWTAVQWLLNAALTANPIGIVIVALAALAAAIVVAYTRSETFRNIVQAAFAAVKVAVDALGSAFSAVLAAASSAYSWITAHWQVALFALGPIGAAISLIATHFNSIIGAAKAAGDAIQAAMDAARAAVDAVAGAVSGLLNLLGSVASKIGSLGGKLNPFMLPPPAAPAVAGRGAQTYAAAGGVTVNVYGAVDPEGTARAILRTLKAHDRRHGRTVTG